MHCPTVVAQARLVNQIAKELGIDLKLPCGMFLDGERTARKESILDKSRMYLTLAPRQL
jgi:hypothetical protein